MVGAAHSGGGSPRARKDVKGYTRAFDVKTGRRLWLFHTVPLKGEFGYDTWLDPDQAANQNRTGVWAQMSGDPDLGLVYLGVELPAVALHLRLGNAVGRAILDDWKVAHLFTVSSGQDYSPTLSLQPKNTTSNLSAATMNQIFLGTPDLTPRSVLLKDPNSGTADFQHQFDASALALPGIYPASDGTGVRNFLHGRPSFGNDLSFVKNFVVQRGRVVELKANF